MGLTGDKVRKDRERAESRTREAGQGRSGQESRFMDIMDKEKREKKLPIQDIALMGVMVAVIEACKAAMAFLPNIELTSFWIIMFTLLFRWRILFVIPVFILVEGAVYGFGLWWVMYLYAWPLLALAVYMCRERESVWFWSFLSAMFGFSFGFLCAFPYVAIGIADSGLRGGLYAGFTWWVAGIPFDIAHGIGNFALMTVLYKPVRLAMKRVTIEKS